MIKQFTSVFKGYPQYGIGVLKGTWTDLQKNWWRHCPIIARHQVQKRRRYLTPFRNHSGSN